MELGAFSVSLSVKNLEESKRFYEKLGFSVFAGGEAQKYLIMKNGSTLIGLFQGMFEGNMLTFNPGWDENAQNLPEYTDVRAIYDQLKSQGVTITSEGFPAEKGPGFIMLQDPDGNPILIDQHI